MSDVAKLAEGLNLTEEQIQQLIKNVKTLQSAKLLELSEEIARAKEGSVITKRGLDLLAKAIAGEQLKFTRVAFGDALRNGEIVFPSDEEILDFTSLINEREISLPIVDVRFAGNGAAILKFSVNNSALEQGFWMRECGLFALDGDEEILYSYKNFGSLGSYIPGGGGAVSVNLIVSLITVVDQATNVVANIDTSILAVTTAEFDAHVQSSHPHPNIPNAATEIVSSNYFWATGADNNLHPISATNLQTQMLGDNLNKLSTLQNRVMQTEINIANLFMQMDSEKALGLDANLLLFEDFIDCKAVDTFSVKVNDEVAGARNVCVEDIDGILEGHYYTLSDGVRSQVVQVSSVAKNDELYVVFFSEDLAYTFDLKKTYLYRTSALIQNGQAGGAGDIKDTSFDFSSLVWQGESSSAAQVLTLATNQNNVKNFTLTGDGGFTSDGFFTIS